MQNVSSVWEDHKGKTFRFTWIKDSNPDKYIPCTQAYGICFDDNGNILLIDNMGMVMIPGGTPEAGDTPVEALQRELLEEADVLVSKIIPLGVQEVVLVDNPEKGKYYQYRFVCSIKELLSQTPDPDNGITHPRKLVPFEEIDNHVKWGVTGQAMFADAIEVYKTQLLAESSSGKAK